MTEPLQERLECGKDDIPQVIADHFQGRYDRLSVSRTGLVEAYVTSHAKLHVVFGVNGFVHDSIAVQFSGLIEGTARCPYKSHDHIRATTELFDCDAWKGGKQSSVFVYVFQFVEQRQRFGIWRVPSVVRLQRLKSVLDVAGGSRAKPSSFEFRVLRAVMADGERYLLGLRSMGLFNDDGEGEVIQSNAHVVDYIADTKRPLIVSRDLSESVAHDLLASYHIVLSDEGSGLLLPIGVQRGFQTVQMSVCP